MVESSHDAGVAAVLLDRFEKQRLPRILRLKEKVLGGEVMSDSDIEFLGQVLEDAHSIKTLVDDHPNYQKLATQAISLYHEITEKALENEKNA